MCHTAGQVCDGLFLCQTGLQWMLRGFAILTLHNRFATGLQLDFIFIFLVLPVLKAPSNTGLGWVCLFFDFLMPKAQQVIHVLQCRTSLRWTLPNRCATSLQRVCHQIFHQTFLFLLFGASCAKGTRVNG